MFPAERATNLWHGVVAGFDGSDRARCAVRWAAGEAAARGCPLHVVRVVEHPAPIAAEWMPVRVGPDERERDRIEEQLVAEVDACRAVNRGVEVHGAMHDGPPYARLAEHAELVGANVLAVGVSELGALPRLVFGSTGAELIRRTSRSVVAVRDLSPVQQATIATGYAPVVAFVDDVVTAARVLDFAFEAADRWRAPVTVLRGRSRPLVPDKSPPAAALLHRLEGVRHRYPRVPVDVETVVAQPLRAVLGHSADARLVVAGHRRHRLAQAKCSVAFVS